MDEIVQVILVQDELGEGPLWNISDQKLYWVDIENDIYHSLDPKTGNHEIVNLGEKIGVLAFRERGGMVMATERGFVFWDPASRLLTRISDPEADKQETRFNDGAVDRLGRFWAGTLGDNFNNSLYRLDPDLTVHKMDSGIDISNGIGWSLDNKVMYFTDSTPKLIYAYDFDLASGTIENRRIFVDSSDRPGVPDGLTVDAEGCIWSARWGGWCLERYDPDGKLERTIKTPAEFPTSVMFGGPDLDVLYFTSARIEIPPDQRTQRPVDGNVFSFRPGMKGVPEPLFKG
jgi:sugar lactone lactonase YvrE